MLLCCLSWWNERYRRPLWKGRQNLGQQKDLVFQASLKHVTNNTENVRPLLCLCVFLPDEVRGTEDLWGKEDRSLGSRRAWYSKLPWNIKPKTQKMLGHFCVCVLSFLMKWEVQKTSWERKTKAWEVEGLGIPSFLKHWTQDTEYVWSFLCLCVVFPDEMRGTEDPVS